MEVETITNSSDETIELGRKIGSQLKGGEVIGLIGPLGSGKTHLIKGIVSGAQASQSESAVNSPTFVIINEYHGKFYIYHIEYKNKSIYELVFLLISLSIYLLLNHNHRI